ncbi:MULTISPECIES: hypothetical protein [Streptomyces]|uniref:Uncharacterized protein n=1 Tax=Streptomyces cavourensis TaxID=67258 RepID=A0ABY5FEV3_9ACTN|nr:MULTISPECIES: hypothetical protein [Streptomyces]TQO30395.1 hypothetical protein FHX79_112221 [Streptomyces cavourensis]UTR82176.1 hypothetical protein NLU04_28705 [Streptomyces cavourensis]GGU66980.1 hypothetical protein GCM10010498_25620 [Streptomyces cavourensis]
MNDQADANVPKPVGTRSVDEVDAETKQISSQILDIIAVKGVTSKSGPGVSTCDGAERGKLFLMRHPWSLTGASDAELAKAMNRLKEDLPKHGWKIVGYGPNSSKAKSLELTADHIEKKFAVKVELWEKNSGGDSNEPTLLVNVVSACYQVPEGQRVDGY